MPDALGFPTAAELAARLGVPYGDTADADDAADALAAAIDYARQESTVLRAHDYAGPEPIPDRARRGTLDLAVWLYERRGSNVDPYTAELTPAQRTHVNRLLGIGAYARPHAAGGPS